jgi:hypothetical protein
MREVVDIGGLPVLLRTADAERTAAVRGLLADLPRSSLRPEASLRYLRRRPAIPSRPPDVASPEVCLWHEGDVLVLADPSGVRARATPSSVWMGGAARDLAAPFHRLFLASISHVLAHHGRFALHAAALVVGDRAIVVVGASGSGKSTLAMAALYAGWRLLGDDTVVLRWDGPGVEVAGLPRRVAAPVEVLARTDGLQMLVADPRGRCVVPDVVLDPGWYPVAGMVLTAHGASPSGGLDPLQGVSLFKHVVQSFPSALTPDLLRSFFAPAAALARLPAWRLQHAVSAEHRVAAAQRWLAHVAEKAP